MNKYLQIIVLSFFMPLVAGSQTWQWAEKVNSINNNIYAGSIDVDKDGNSYITGDFYNSASFGSTTITTPGLVSAFIAKYDINGNLLWAKAAGSGSDVEVYGICVDKSGNISLTGIFKGTSTFGSRKLTSVGDFDVFVSHYNSDGDIQWAQSAGDTGFDYAGSISHDAIGNVYVTGDFHISAFSGSSSKIFVAKYDSTGANVWLKKPTEYSDFHLGDCIKTDSAGNSYFTGQFFDGLTFDSSIILNTGNKEDNAYIGKMNTDGKVLWLQEAGAATGYMGANGIDIDKAGNAYITGFYRGTVSFGSLSLTGPAGLYYSMFIAKCNTSGEYIWVNKSTGPAGSSNGSAVSVDNAGNCYFGGSFSVPITLDSTTLTNSGYTDVFVTKIDSLGNFIWATNCGSPYSTTIKGIKANSKSVFLSGNFLGDINFGSHISLSADTTIRSLYTAKLTDTTLTASVPNTNYPHYSVFPNPVTNYIQLNGIAGNEHYIIYDVHGRQIMQGDLNNANKISVVNLQSGIYFIDVFNKSNPERTDKIKFIKN
ncbi:MAG TPA: T9SS type A sorting domain-containing protein [Flavipsychrobacter sp.]|nr:T9SS type A sorting domain-containing protein [Flavipsychrobacter sp.]